MTRLALLESGKSSSAQKRFKPRTITKESFKGLPPKFKMPTIPLFDGTSDALAHAQVYTMAMHRSGASEKAMALCFPETLEKSARDWYLTLPKGTQGDWDLLCDAFQEQFEDNTQLKPTKRDLEQTFQNEGESFAEFATRWRNKMMEIVDRPSPKEQKEILLRCCLVEYKRVLIGPHYENFAQLYEAGVRVDEFFRETKAQEKKTSGNVSTYRPNKGSGSSSQSKDSSVNTVVLWFEQV